MNAIVIQKNTMFCFRFLTAIEIDFLNMTSSSYTAFQFWNNKLFSFYLIFPNGISVHPGSASRKFCNLNFRKANTIIFVIWYNT